MTGHPEVIPKSGSGKFKSLLRPYHAPIGKRSIRGRSVGLRTRNALATVHGIPPKPFPTITAWEVLEHSSAGDGTGLALFSCPRPTEEEYPLSRQPSTINYPLSSTFGTLAGLRSQQIKIILTAPESLASAPNCKPRSSFRGPRMPQ